MTTGSPPILQTARLTLRPLAMSDAQDLFPMYNDSETMRFMPSLPHQTIADTEKHLTHELGMRGSKNWAICWKDSDEAIGHLHYLGQTRFPGMGYVIKREFWGQGVVAEAAQAALAYGFETLSFDRVELWIDETNLASKRVAEKLNFRLKGRLALRYSHRPNHHVMQVYGLWAHEWRGDSPEETRPRFFSMQPVLKVYNVSEAVAFYCHKLGFGIDFMHGNPVNYAGVSRGDWSGSMVSLHLAQVPSEQEILPSTALYIMVDTNLERLCETYRVNGVEIIAEPITHPWGMREFSVRDNTGYVLHLGTQV